MKTRIALAAALLLAACGGRNPTPDAGGNPRAYEPRDSTQRELFAAFRAAQMPSVYALIGARERLKLTSRQVTALDSIAEVAREQNRPLTDSLRSLTNSGSGGPIRAPRGEFQSQRFIPALRRMGENNRRAVEAIQALLTPEQRTGACELAREQREQRYADRRRGGMGGRREGRGRGRMGDRMLGMDGDDVRDGRGGAGGWPWCPAPARGPARPPAPTDPARATAGALRS